MRLTFYFDQSRCMACNACTVSCKDWNQVNPGAVRWRTQATYELKGPVFDNLSMACNHCEKPACLEACTVGAIHKREDGIVFVDRDRCESLTLCVDACPFAVPMLAGDKQEPVAKDTWQLEHPMQKCDFCRDRIDKGDKPVCVMACAAHALDCGDYDTMIEKYPDATPLNKRDFPYAFVNNGKADTHPSFLIRKRRAQKVTKAL